jgi:hypothetical protein
MEIRDKIIRAYKMLLARDAHLLIVDANERSLTHRLAMYLQAEFPDYNVDCEYNRNGMDAKKLVEFKKQIASDDTDGVTVYPDIIVHHRGTTDNFIVIEAKKTTNGNRDDIEKLMAYKAELHYHNAYFILFPAGEDFRGFREDMLEEYIQEVN